jgi:hypothetical protein
LGCSATNEMAVSYHSNRIFDVWTALGNKGWDRETMTPDYKTSHRLSPDLEKELALDNMQYKLHRTDGLIQIGVIAFTTPVNKLFGKTMANLNCKAARMT